MGQHYFFKATLDGGRAGYDKNFIYHLGLNTHPCPDMISKNPCGIGIHLARNISRALQYVPDATEFYLATPYKILGSDEEKVRTDSCEILLLIPRDYVEAYRKAVAPTLEAYTKAAVSASGAYSKARASGFCRASRRAYSKAIVSAWEDYRKIVAPTLGDYRKAVAPTLEDYWKAVAPTLEAYRKAIASAHKGLIRKCLRDLKKIKEGKIS